MNIIFVVSSEGNIGPGPGEGVTSHGKCGGWGQQILKVWCRGFDTRLPGGHVTLSHAAADYLFIQS